MDAVKKLKKLSTALLERYLANKRKLNEKELLKVIALISQYSANGYTIHKSISALSRNSNKKIASMASSITRSMAGGTSLTDSFKRTGAVEEDILTVLDAAVKADTAKITGALYNMLLHLRSIKKAFNGMMIAPAIYISLAFVGMATMAIYVIPNFEGMFDRMHVDLPPAASLLMSTRRFVEDNFITVSLTTSSIIFIIWKFVITNEPVRYAVENALFRVPRMGEFFLKTDIARATSYLGLLLAVDPSGHDALTRTSEIVKSLVLKKALLTARADVTSGTDIATSIERSSPLWPVELIDAVRAGAETNRIEEEMSSFSAIMRGEVLSLIEDLSPFVNLLSVGFSLGIIGFLFSEVMLGMFANLSGKM